MCPIGQLMLARGLGIGELIQATKRAYVQAAITHILPPGSRLNASRLAVATGLTRKDVSTLLGEISGSLARKPLRTNEQRAFRVLTGWTIDPRFCNRRGRPARLPLRGPRRSFGLLVKLYGGDVTPNAVLKELERMRIVKLAASGRLILNRMHQQDYSVQQMWDLARLFADFAKTLSMQRSHTRYPVFFGFKDSLVGSPEQAARFQRTFGSRASILLQSVDQWLAAQPNVQTDLGAAPESTCRVGLGVYLVQEDQPSAETAFVKNRRKVFGMEGKAGAH